MDSFSSSTINHIPVVAMALFHPLLKKYLIVRRAAGQSGAGLWEFPGGKIELQETPHQALIREIREELSLDISAEELVYISENIHTYPRATIHLKMYRVVRVVEKFILVDHDAWDWVDQESIQKYELSGADHFFVPLLFNSRDL